MKSVSLFSAMLAISGAVAAQNIENVIDINPYSARSVGVMFDLPQGTSDCVVRVFNAQSPTVPVAEAIAYPPPGSRYTIKRGAILTITGSAIEAAKEVNISCHGQTAGTVSHSFWKPAPPTVSVQMKGVPVGDNQVHLTGSISVQGHGKNTYCEQDHDFKVIPYQPFLSQLANQAPAWDQYYAIDTVSNTYQGWGVARVVCYGQGGTTSQIVEFKPGSNGEYVVDSYVNNYE